MLKLQVMVELHVLEMKNRAAAAIAHGWYIIKVLVTNICEQVETIAHAQSNMCSVQS